MPSLNPLRFLEVREVGPADVINHFDSGVPSANKRLLTLAREETESEALVVLLEGIVIAYAEVKARTYRVPYNSHDLAYLSVELVAVNRPYRSWFPLVDLYFGMQLYAAQRQLDAIAARPIDLHSRQLARLAGLRESPELGLFIALVPISVRNHPNGDGRAVIESDELLKASLSDRDLVFRVFYAVHRSASALAGAVRKLEHLIAQDAPEEAFQEFFTRFPGFLLGDAYASLHPQVTLVAENSELLRPDFLLEPIDPNAFCDILELKRPSAPIVVGTSRHRRPSSQLAAAFAQLRDYQNYFESATARVAFQSKSGLKVFRPQLSVLIGRSTTPIQLAGGVLRPEVTVVT